MRPITLNFSSAAREQAKLVYLVCPIDARSWLFRSFKSHALVKFYIRYDTIVEIIQAENFQPNRWDSSYRLISHSGEFCSKILLQKIRRYWSSGSDSSAHKKKVITRTATRSAIMIMEHIGLDLQNFDRQHRLWVLREFCTTTELQA